MLIILEDGKEKAAKKIFDKWDLDFAVVGKATDTNNLTLKFNNKIEGEIPYGSSDILSKRFLRGLGLINDKF